MSQMIDLSLPIEKLKNVGTRNAPRLYRLGIKTIKDLLWHFPSRYEDYSETIQISEIEPGQKVNIQGEIIKITTKKLFPRRMFITNAIVKDLSGAIKAVWFNQPFIENKLPEGAFVSLAGKVKIGKNGIYLSSPTYERIDYVLHGPQPATSLKHTKGLIPVYPETEGITSKYLRFLIKPLLSNLYLNDPIPKKILVKYNFPTLSEAIKKIHFPDSKEQADIAKERLAFDDLFIFQIKALLERRKLNQLKSASITFDEKLIKDFISTLPFELTKDQKIALYEILKDLEKNYPMNRLLEGDVGSGKTVVALIAAYEVLMANYQSVFMAPTEVLAQQHYTTITSLLSNLKNQNESKKQIIISLLTSSSALLNGKKIKKNDLKKIIEKGTPMILVGTHAIIQKDLKFGKLALAIIDEQHRFGVNQRKALISEINTELALKNKENKIIPYKELSNKIRGLFFEIKKNLGLGHKESIYHNAFEEMIKKNKIKYDKEKNFSNHNDSKNTMVYQPDFVIDDKIIVELKSNPFILDEEKKQLWTYLKNSNYESAFLINFGGNDLDIQELIKNSNKNSEAILTSSGYIPHLLSMTATPIPRTLALTIYGDLDISIIKEKPKNRQKVETKIITPSQRKSAYQFIREEIQKGKQAFVVCPRIELSEIKNNNTNNKKQKTNNPKTTLKQTKMNLLWQEVKAVEEEYKKLSEEIFPDLKVAMLHGKLKSKEKNKIMKDFKDGKYDILVSTSVIEVGVDIPNATIIIIENAERFGLAQLHQFRGRVGRGKDQSYCLLFSSSTNVYTNERLKALINCEDGFELAEKDMAIRGPGEFMGTKQSGMPDLVMASLANMSLIKKARTEARLILNNDSSLSRYPLLKNRLNEFQKIVHFE
jgi:ATP-dependent DNA helicase RecG